MAVLTHPDFAVDLKPPLFRDSPESSAGSREELDSDMGLSTNQSRWVNAQRMEYMELTILANNTVDRFDHSTKMVEDYRMIAQEIGSQ